MAKKNVSSEKSSVDVAKKKLEEEKKKLISEQRIQKKEAKKRAKEISRQEAELADDSDSNPISAFVITLFIVLIWLAIISLLIKLDIGGFGSNVLKPILKDVPVINMILPKDGITETSNGEAYYGYTSLKDAVEQIKVLELDLEQAQILNGADTEELTSLRAEVERLKTFEDNQVEFQRIKTEFYEEVIYSDKGPGAKEYQKYYEAMDPTTAEYLYKQVIIQEEESKKILDYAKAYSAMKPKAAAGIFEAMTDNLEQAARILGVLEADERGKILGVMKADVAAKITKIMNPDS
ncbi:MAG TPA: hypothetical protein VJZ04_11160 [Lachnospiraceae bacterium]|nr:hypothetical protein [Lachnospiraceae bacterium]